MGVPEMVIGDPPGTNVWPAIITDQKPSETAVTALPAMVKMVVRGGEFATGKVRGTVLVPMTM